MNEVAGGVKIEGRSSQKSKMDSQLLKSGVFNFQGSNYSKGDYSIASVLLGASQNYSVMSKSLSDFDSKTNRTNVPTHKKKIVRKFSRFKTQGNTVILSEESSDDESSKESYLLEEENMSDGDHDNPAGLLINLYH